MLVLLWGLESDPPLFSVRERLQSLGVPTKFIDQRRVLDTKAELAVGNKVEGRVNIGDEKINLDKVTAVYLRPYESVRLPVVAAAGPGSPAWDHAFFVEDILASWSEVTPAFVVNRCAAMAANGSKPYQLELIRDLGWSVPETLVTTDPDAARAFWDQHGEVIYKSVSAVRSRVSRLRSEHMDRFSSITSCPTQFQQYVDGVDHRVHVVGEEVFACEVLCTADDYRYSVEDIPDVRACSLPQDIEEKCRDLAAAMDLPLAGIDLRRTPHGEWFCFEVNPSPAFTYYEAETGQPIGAAIARLLANGRPATATDVPCPSLDMPRRNPSAMDSARGREMLQNGRTRSCSLSPPGNNEKPCTGGPPWPPRLGFPRVFSQDGP